MKIKNSFNIDLPLAQAWPLLNDVPRVARCAPGAELIEAHGDDSYLGSVAVKLGPVALKFKGTFTYKEKDEAAHRVVAEAKGNEEKARGNARAEIVFVLTEAGEKTRVDIESDVLLSGSIAQYGRGTAIMQSTAQALIDQFAHNLSAELQAQPQATPAQTAAATRQTAAAAEGPETHRAAAQAKPISLPRLMLASLMNLFRQWFGRGSR